MPPDGEREASRSIRDGQSALLRLITGQGASAVPLEALIVGDARAGAGERLAVYAHMYRARIVEALESQFPRLAKHLGADAFADLGAAYIADEPSRHPSLRLVGERLPGWLAARRYGDPTIGGLAVLEWARTDVFDLADEPTSTVEALRAWPAERFAELPLRLITAHRIVTVAAGTASLWDAIGARGETSAVSVTSAGEGVESLLVWREGSAVYHRLLDELELAGLTLAAAGTSLGTMCDALLASVGTEDAAAQAFAWIATWATDGLLYAS